MNDIQGSQSITSGDAATEIGVGVHTIRRWCEWHAVHLSPGANPPPGAPRQIVWRDILVFKAIKEMRSQGLQTPAINERLASMTIATVEAEDDIPNNDVTPPSSHDVMDSPANSFYGDRCNKYRAATSRYRRKTPRCGRANSKNKFKRFSHYV